MSHTSSLCSRVVGVVGVVGVDSTISVNKATTPPAEHSYTPLSPGCGSGIRSVFPSAGIGRDWLSCRDHSTSTPGDTLHVSTTSSPAIVVPEEGPSMITVAKRGGGKCWGGRNQGWRKRRERKRERERRRRRRRRRRCREGDGESVHHHVQELRGISYMDSILFPVSLTVDGVNSRCKEVTYARW